MAESFSQRHGLAGPPSGILIRKDAPPSIRIVFMEIVNNAKLEGINFQKVICKALQVFPKNQWTHHWDEARELVWSCEWYRFYDVAEGVWRFLYEKHSHYNPGVISEFEKSINQAFIQENIGWRLVSGKIVTRGNEGFENTVKTASTVLAEDGKPTAAEHLHSAISALSVRPKPNTSGAVAHATNAVECVLNAITGEAMTLGKYLDKRPELVHPALKKGLEGIYGYASDEGARHGKEGPNRRLRGPNLQSPCVRLLARC